MKRFFVALTLLTALSICLHSGYAQQNENEELGFVGMPVDQRTAAVADAIVAAVPGVDAAADVTAEHLAAITELTITSSTPLSLNEGDFDSLTGLTTLDLSDNQIDSLSTDGPEAIFARLESLTTLDLSRNSLSSLPEGIFDNLTALTTLDLSHNPINSVPDGIFDDLTSLTTLTIIAGFQLSNQISRDIFDNLTALTTLDLSDNALSNFPFGIFDNLTALTTLNLHNNLPPSLPGGIFNNLTSLTTLRLSGNPRMEEIEDGSIFDNLTSLTTLDLSGNRLMSLDAALFDQITALTDLDLSTNLLTALPAGIFNNNSALESLDITANHLSTLPENVFSSLSALESLYLAYNQFDALPDGLFSGLENLEEYALEGNPGSPFRFVISLTSEVQESGNIIVLATVAAGTPFDIEMPINVSDNGTILGSDSLTITKGNTTSTDGVEVASTATGDITVDITVGTGPTNLDSYSVPSLTVTKDEPLVVPDIWEPTVALSVPEGLQNGAFEVTITFNEPVEDFLQEDVSLTDNTATASITNWEVSTDETTYTATLIPTTNGDVSISVPEAVANDASENANTASTTHTVNVDVEPPTVSISLPTNIQTGEFQATITFNEPVDDFVQADVWLNSPTANAVPNFSNWSKVSITNWVAAADKMTYTATITPSTTGGMSLRVREDVATDAAKNGNTASNQPHVLVDVDPPTVSIAVPESIQATAFDAILTFNEPVEDSQSVSLTGSTATASITNWAASADKTRFTATITPTTSGVVNISVPENSIVDAAGHPNTASTIHTVTVDLSPPTVTVSVPSDKQAATFDATISFSKPVTDFLADDILIAGTATASVTNLVGVDAAPSLTRPLPAPADDGMTYTATFTATTSGTVEFSIRPDAVIDAGDRPNVDESATKVVTVDLDGPTVTLSVPETTQPGAFDVTITFNEPVEDFLQEDVSLIEGTAETTISYWVDVGDDMTYTATVTPTTSGEVFISVPENVATDEVGNSNTASDTYIVTVNLNALTAGITLPIGEMLKTFDVTIAFKNAVSDFVPEDISLEGTTARVSITNLVSEDNASYTASFTAKTAGVMSISVPAGVATDANSNTNLASKTEILTIDFVVDISDANLETAVKTALDIRTDAELLASDVLSLTELKVESGTLASLSGVEPLINLTTLEIQGVSGDEVAPLTDLTPLADLTDLTELTVRFTEVSDVSPLIGLTELTSLTLTDNAISDITPLADLSTAIELITLALTGNEISNVAPLAALTSLETLSLAENLILDTSSLYPLLTANGGRLETVDIDVTEHPPWDVNKDGVVDAADLVLVTAALGQVGEDILDPGTDVNSDGTVDNADLILVTDNSDTGNGAPGANISIANLIDPAILETLDRDVLEAQLRILRTESDGSAKYRDAIAMIEAFLAAARPHETVLLPNYPNPFNPETWIPYHLANPSDVVITIYDARGSVIRRLELGHQSEGYYTSQSRAVYWDGRNNVGEPVASGIYFYQLQADNTSLLRKMVILK